MSYSLDEHREAFDRHPAFESGDTGYRLTSAAFPLAVSFEETSDETVAYTVEANLPSLDAVIVDDTLSDALLEGWAIPMEQRLADIDQATTLRDVSLTCEWDREGFAATFRFERPPAAPAPTDELVAMAGYVEGTYLQGTIPGYTYRDPVGELLDAARDRATGIEPP